MKAPTGLASQVFRLDLWMGSYGARTPKRTRLWSNSKVISGFFTSEKLKTGEACPLQDHKEVQGQHWPGALSGEQEID